MAAGSHGLVRWQRLGDGVVVRYNVELMVEVIRRRADDKGDERIFSFEVPSISSVCFLLSLI